MFYSFMFESRCYFNLKDVNEDILLIHVTSYFSDKEKNKDILSGIRVC